MNSSGSYHYQPLDPENSDAIRLLVLQPNADIQAPVNCDLINTTLSECDDDVVDHYSALSYVWGDVDDRREITVDSKIFHVTVNLESALRHMRDASRPRRIWADAICINQADDEEKSSQVQQMGAVYQSARHTIIYLGEATEQSTFLLRYVRRHQDESRAFSDFKYARQIVELSDWSAILSRPWYHRVWIFQELVFSSDPWVQCGEVRARWDQLRVTLKSLQASRNLDSMLLDVFYSMDKRRMAFRDAKKQESSRQHVIESLYEVLESRRGMGVTDSRDMVFAHLGIIATEPGDRDSLLKVDYGKSSRKVFCDLARYMMDYQAQKVIWNSDMFSQASKSLKLLSYVDTPGDPERPVTQLPSWIPDWTSVRPPPYRRLRLDTVEMDSFRKRWKLSPYIQSNFPYLGPCHFWPEDSILACFGYHIGTISHISPVMFDSRYLDKTQSNPSTIELRKQWHVLEAYWQEISSKPSSPITNLLPRETQELEQKDSESPFMPKPTLPANTGFLPIGIHKNQNSNPGETLWKQFLNRMNGLDQLEIAEGRRRGRGPKIVITPAPSDKPIALSRISQDEGGLNLCHGRRLAILDNGRMCLVPEASSIDDLLCCFFGDMIMQYTLRRDVDGLLYQSNMDMKIKRGIGPFTDAAVSHCHFVGESLLDGWLQWNPMEAFHKLLAKEDIDTEPNFDNWLHKPRVEAIGQVFALH